MLIYHGSSVWVKGSWISFKHFASFETYGLVKKPMAKRNCSPPACAAVKGCFLNQHIHIQLITAQCQSNEQGHGDGGGVGGLLAAACCFCYRVRHHSINGWWGDGGSWTCGYASAAKTCENACSTMTECPLRAIWINTHFKSLANIQSACKI